MQKGFGLIGILIVIAIIGVLGVGALKTGFPQRNPFVPNAEEKSAIDMAEEMKDAIEQKNKETMPVTNSTQDETANWKTYRNEEYGIEFRYPKDWTITETKLSNDHPDSYLKVRITVSNGLIVQGEKLSKDNVDTVSAFQVTFRGSENKPQLDIEKWYDVSPEGDDEVVSKKVTSVDGKKAVCTETLWRDFMVLRCFVSRGTSIIEIGFSPSQTKFINDYEDILSTFKIIN